MKRHVPLFKLESEKELIKSSEIEYSLSKFGNGFFISDDGLIATLAHVLKDDDTTCNYALVDHYFYKIDILESNLTEEDGNFVDAALCKIAIRNSEYFDPISFARVKVDSSLVIKGYSRILKPVDNKNQSNFFGNNFFEIKAECLDLIYGVNMKNFFTVRYSTSQGDLNGMSGSPVINEDNMVVGVLKGGKGFVGINNGRYQFGQVLHIKTITDMFIHCFGNTL